MSEREMQSPEAPSIPAPFIALLAQIDAARAILDACEATTRALAAGSIASSLRAQQQDRARSARELAPMAAGKQMPPTFGAPQAATPIAREPSSFSAERALDDRGVDDASLIDRLSCVSPDAARDITTESGE